MVNSSTPESGQAVAEVLQASPRPTPIAWILKRLDSLLSEDLRRSAPSTLTRARVLAGASGFMCLFALFAAVALPSPGLQLTGALLGLGYVLTLVLLRRARAPEPPALVMCTTSLLASAPLIYLMRDNPYIGLHAGIMLQPALAVYLLGPRQGFLLTLSCVCGGLLFPLYYTRLGAGMHSAPDPLYWPLYFCAVISFVGVWAVGSLHSAARSEAQATVEQTLKELRAHEDKLRSLIDSTHDLMVSLDPEGHLLIANSAAKIAYRLAFGQEPRVGQPFVPESSPGLRARWRPRFTAALAGQRQRFEEAHEHGGVRLTFDASVNPIRDAQGRVTGVTLFGRNITARKEAELRLGEMHRTLVDVSRQAGMAEIATGVLHNVGNTLNSVNVSTLLLVDQLRKSRLPGLGKANALLREHTSDLASFLSRDPQGQQLPAYLSALFDQLNQEHEAQIKELRSLSDSVEHIKSIVSMQQKHARATGAVEEVTVPQLIDEALRLHAISFGRLGIHIERDYADVPPLLVDRHRLLQILVNLMSNARDALTASETREKRLSISVHPVPEHHRLRLQVADNGVGIAPEHLARLFTQGFTTKKEGHGFGLHISALAAMEMKGQLTCTSPGLGHGATFTLELPTEAPAS